MQSTSDQLTQAERDKVRDFIKSLPVAVLATADDFGNPHASVIYITTDDDLHLTFTTKEDTNKYKDIAHNNHVVLVVYEAKSQTTVQISGRAAEVTDQEAQQQIYKGTLHAAEQTGEDVVPPVAKIAAGRYVGFTIEIDKINWSEYGWGNSFAKALEHVGDPQNNGDPM